MDTEEQHASLAKWICPGARMTISHASKACLSSPRMRMPEEWHREVDEHRLRWCAQVKRPQPAQSLIHVALPVKRARSDTALPIVAQERAKRTRWRKDADDWRFALWNSRVLCQAMTYHTVLDDMSVWRFRSEFAFGIRLRFVSSFCLCASVRFEVCRALIRTVWCTFVKEFADVRVRYFVCFLCTFIRLKCECVFACSSCSFRVRDDIRVLICLPVARIVLVSFSRVLRILRYVRDCRMSQCTLRCIFVARRPIRLQSKCVFES